MRIRCLVIDKNVLTHNRIMDSLKDIPIIDAQSSKSFRDSASAIYSIQPNLIFLRCGESREKEERVLKVLTRLKWKYALIPILSKPLAQLIEGLMREKSVVDILTDNAEADRIEAALKKAFAHLDGAAGASHFRGFMGFVGIIPSLRERKILSESGIGFIQNRSLRLAIDYWRKNPDSQLIGVAFNAFETFTTRPDELIECWDDFDLRPWEYGLYEAQKHYMEYWKVPIKEGLLPPTVPALLREGEDLRPLSPNDVQRVLIKVGQMIRMGDIDEIFQTMGISFRDDDPTPHPNNYDEYIKKLEKQLEEVDRKHPRLTRPPEETGWENFKPDKAIANNDDSLRMAFHQRKR